MAKYSEMILCMVRAIRNIHSISIAWKNATLTIWEMQQIFTALIDFTKTINRLILYTYLQFFRAFYLYFSRLEHNFFISSKKKERILHTFISIHKLWIMRKRKTRNNFRVKISTYHFNIIVDSIIISLKPQRKPILNCWDDWCSILWHHKYSYSFQSESLYQCINAHIFVLCLKY